jgi:hypothetical protein
MSFLTCLDVFCTFPTVSCAQIPVVATEANCPGTGVCSSYCELDNYMRMSPDALLIPHFISSLLLLRQLFLFWLVCLVWLIDCRIRSFFRNVQYDWCLFQPKVLIPGVPLRLRLRERLSIAVDPIHRRYFFFFFLSEILMNPNFCETEMRTIIIIIIFLCVVLYFIHLRSSCARLSAVRVPERV